MEWLEYHRLVGVDHFFLYDTTHIGSSSTYSNATHNVSSSSSSSTSSSSTSSSSSSSPLSSTGSGVGSGGQLYSMGGRSLRDMLKDYLALGLVTIVPWHHPEPTPTQPQYQRSHHQTETTQAQAQEQEQDHQREKNPQLHRLKSLALTSCYTR